MALDEMDPDPQPHVHPSLCQPVMSLKALNGASSARTANIYRKGHLPCFKRQTLDAQYNINLNDKSKIVL